MENKCKKCYENDKTPDENDCKKCQKVIIDGVDVSRCRFFIKEYIEDGYTEDDGCVYIKNSCGINGTECCLVPDCYYKKMKRLEAENAKMKQVFEEINEEDVNE
jgi:hypothetical protein